MRPSISLTEQENMTKRQDPGKGRRQAMHTIESLLAMSEEYGECCEWTGYTASSVPMVSHQGRMVGVRRLILDLHKAPLTTREVASTTCQNPICINPDHIKVKTRRQHASSMAKAPTRAKPVIAAKLAQYARREKSKLTIEVAREIRMSEETGPVLAERFGVSKTIINRIKRGDRWREFSSPFAGLGARA